MRKLRVRTVLSTLLVFASMGLDLPEDPDPIPARILVEKEACSLPLARTAYQGWYVRALCPKA